MGVFDMFKRGEVDTVQSHGSMVQLNMWVNNHTKKDLKALSIEFNVTRNIVGQHALDIGTFYLRRIAADKEKAEITRRHMIDDHAHGTGGDDPRPILRLGEENDDIAKLLAMIQPIVRDYEALEWAMPTAKRMGNYQPALRLEKEFERKAEIFVIWATKEFFK